jgi:hypothetical protein
MSKFFPTPEEAMEALTAEASLDALDGKRTELVACAKWAIQRELMRLEEVTQENSWGIRADQRTSESVRYRWVYGPWYVPVRPHPSKKEHKERSVLCSRRTGVKSVRHSVATVAVSVLWNDMTRDDMGATWNHGLGSPSAPTAAMTLARLKLARADADFWAGIDRCYGSVYALRAMGHY